MSKKIKILQIINSIEAGGAENILLQLCRNLDKEKYEIAVATVMGGGSLEKEFERAGIKLFLYHKKSKIGLDALKNLRQVIREFNPDIVHTHLWSGDTWGRIAAYLEKKKIIISTEHNRNVDEGRWKKCVKHFLSYFTTKIVASSEGIKDYQIKAELIHKDKIEVIRYGIELERFPFRGIHTYRYGEEWLKILNIGRLTPQKNQRLLIEAMARLGEVYPDVHLTLAGEGELKESLADVADRLHIKDNVEFAGKVADPLSLYQQADIFAFPSIFEGLGVVLLEALAVGVPVIAANIPAVDEVIEDEVNGLLFESDNSDDLVEKIIYLIKNPEMQERMILAGRKMVEEKFTVSIMVTKYSELYQQLCVS